jgi:hypothetical protein
VKKVLVLALILPLSACAYHFGLTERALPGGYKQLAIPMFKNLSQEVGIEADFTNALIRRFARGKVAQITDKNTAPLTLEGTIQHVDVTSDSPQNPTQLYTLPTGTVLNTQYRIVVTSEIVLRRKSDDRILWRGSFRNEKVYPAPRIGQTILNSANATYNQSAKLAIIATLADDQMAEAHDRITESF